MIFYVSGNAEISFTQRVEAATSEEAAEKVRNMRVVDLMWDSESITIDDVAQQAERAP